MKCHFCQKAIKWIQEPNLYDIVSAAELQSFHSFRNLKQDWNKPPVLLHLHVGWCDAENLLINVGSYIKIQAAEFGSCVLITAAPPFEQKAAGKGWIILQTNTNWIPHDQSIQVMPGRGKMCPTAQTNQYKCKTSLSSEENYGILPRGDISHWKCTLCTCVKLYNM